MHFLAKTALLLCFISGTYATDRSTTEGEQPGAAAGPTAGVNPTRRLLPTRRISQQYDEGCGAGTETSEAANRYAGIENKLARILEEIFKIQMFKRPNSFPGHTQEGVETEDVKPFTRPAIKLQRAHIELTDVETPAGPGASDANSHEPNAKTIPGRTHMVLGGNSLLAQETPRRPLEDAAGNKDDGEKKKKKNKTPGFINSAETKAKNLRGTIFLNPVATNARPTLQNILAETQVNDVKQEVSIISQTLEDYIKKLDARPEEQKIPTALDNELLSTQGEVISQQAKLDELTQELNTKKWALRDAHGTQLINEAQVQFYKCVDELAAMEAKKKAGGISTAFVRRLTLID